MPRTISLLTVAFLFVPAAIADDHAAKIVGTWKLTKSEKLPAGATTTWVFNKEGTASTTLVLKDGSEQVFAHRWMIEGDKLITTTKAGKVEKVDTATIIKITDKTMWVRDPAGNDETFTRLK